MKQVDFLEFVKAAPQNMSIAHTLEWWTHYEENFHNILAYAELVSEYKCSDIADCLRFASAFSKDISWPIQICILYTKLHFTG